MLVLFKFSYLTNDYDFQVCQGSIWCSILIYSLYAVVLKCCFVIILYLFLYSWLDCHLMELTSSVWFSSCCLSMRRHACIFVMLIGEGYLMAVTQICHCWTRFFGFLFFHISWSSRSLPSCNHCWSYWWHQCVQYMCPALWSISQIMELALDARMLWSCD